MGYLPFFFDTGAGAVLLAGAGPAAQAKLRLLLGVGAAVRWYPGAADVAEEVILAASRDARLEVDPGDPLDAALSGIFAVVSAHGDARDDAVSARMRAQGIPVNVVDRPDLSSFIFPAIVARGEVVVAIGTGGAAPVLARRIREKIDAVLPARIGELAALMGRYRERFAGLRRVSARLFWEHVVDGPVGALALAGRRVEAERRLAADLAATHLPARHAPGTVFLVGAGPGDADLLTLRALQVLADADVIFHDDLVSDDVLARARRDAERICVGKRQGRRSTSQDEINRLLAAAATAGRRVVRLKGGDPFVFGRGGEELAYLRARGIPVVVVPGITAALGCAAEIGLPLTCRGEAARLSFVTAHAASGRTDWNGLADPGHTVVVYMGLSSAQAVRDGLVAAGRDADTPAAVLARGTTAQAQAVAGRLDDLPQLAAAAGEGPALLVIGEVVAHAAIRPQAPAASREARRRENEAVA